MGRYEYYKSGKEWRWRFVAKNGETIGSGEGYKRKIDCKHAIALLQASASASVIEIKPKSSKSQGVC